MVKNDFSDQSSIAHDAAVSSIFERHHTVMLIIEPVTGAITYANPAAEKFYRYSRATLCTMLISDINQLPPEDVVSLRRKAQTNEQNTFVFPHKLANGEIRTVEADSSPIVIDGRPMLLSLIHDITDRMHAEALYRESEERQRAILNNIPDPAWLKDMEGRYLVVNKAWTELYGLSESDVLGKHISEFMYPEIARKIDDEDRIVTSQGQELKYEDLLVDKRKGAVWFETVRAPLVDKTGHIIGSTGISRDITERKKKEAELSRLNRTFKAISSSGQAMMRATDESEYLEEVCRIITNECRHPMVWIGYAEEDAFRSVRPVMSSGFEDGYLETLRISWADTERGQGPTGMAIRTGRPNICRDMLHDPRFAPWRDDAVRRGYASSIALPLTIHDSVLGALTIYSQETDAFSDDEVMLLNELAEDLAYGIAAIRMRVAHEKAAEALRQMEHRYHSLFNLMTEGFALHEIIYDEDGTPVDYRYLDVNPSFEQLTGLKREDVIGRTKREVAPDNDPLWSITAGSVVQTGIPATLDYFSPAVNRHYHVLVYRSAPDQFAVIFTDITAHRQMQDEIRRSRDLLEEKVVERTLALKKSEDRFRNTLDNLVEGCMIVDFEWTYLYLNDAMADQWGRVRKNIIGRRLVEADTGTQTVAAFECYRVVMEHRIPQTTVTDYTRPDGSTAWFELRCVPVPEGIFVMSSDITERKRAELALRQYNEQLLGFSQRLIEAQEAERRKIAYELHDEIGQVLTAIQLNLRGISEYEDVADVPLRLEECIALVDRLLQQVRELSVDLRPWMLDQLGLVPSVRWYVDKQGQRGKIKTEFTVENLSGRFPPIIEITSYRVIQESMTNILRHSHATEVRVTLGTHQGVLHAQIIDNGDGFDPRQVREKPIGKQGLGMLGMEERVTSLGGKMTIESQPGKGTTLRFTLPLKER